MDESELLTFLATARRPTVLATVISTKGSTPRKVGARMLVDEDGVVVGTIGGGCGEGMVIEAAQSLLGGDPPGAPRTVRIELTDDFTTWSPAVCGGVMDVFVELANPERAPEDTLLP